DELQQPNPAHQPEVAGHRADEHGFHDHLPDNVRRGSAQGLADADLAGAFLHHDQHDVANAHDAGHNGADADDPQEGVDPPEYLAEDLRVLHVVVHMHGPIVGGVEAVPGRQHCHGAALRLLSTLDGTVHEAEGDLVHPLVGVEHALHHAQRNEDLAVLVHAPAAALEAVHAHYLEGDVVHLHPLIDGVLALEERIA